MMNERASVPESCGRERKNEDLLRGRLARRIVTDLIGRTLSHYRITSAIGAGGMGEVYRATDTALRRDVAIKVLPPEVAGDAERLGRFRREAHLLASLNHPNIAAIYGLEESGGQPFIALELVEGEDLKERLARGPIPVAEALVIAEQIAEALEEAHNKGIVHRDLKPANVKLAHDGRVKVLDFGLAKAWAGEPGDARSSGPLISQSPTFAHTQTIAGVILGTAAYMSPEQARGKPVDRRADVWAFGVLLWEMLTGRALFGGPTVTDVIAAVVTKEPDLDALPAETPRAVRHLLARCLRKDPRMRLPDIGAARLELQDAIAGTASEPGTPPAALEATARAERRGRRRERWAWAGVAFVAASLAGVLAFVHFRETEPPPSPAARFTVDAPGGWRWLANWGWPVPSPDGRQLVFPAVREGVGIGESAVTMLWQRPLDSLTSRPLAGTDGAMLPMWSPDGRSVAFFTEKELRRINLDDGTVQRVCVLPVTGLSGGTWSASGTILFATGGEAGQIYAVPAAGGEAKPLMTVDRARGEANHHNPQFLPDGRRFFFSVYGEDRAAGLYLSSLDTPDERQRIVPGAARRLYADGHLFFHANGTLMAQPFDLQTMALGGDPVAIGSSLGAWEVDPGYGWFGASPGGTLAYTSQGAAASEVQLTWRDRKGGDVGTIGAPGSFSQIVLSPDERNIAFEMRDAAGRYDLWVMDAARGVSSRVTLAEADKRDPVWAPDGRSLVFIARTDKGPELRRKGLRAGDAETVVAAVELDYIPESWLPDDTLLVIRRNPQTDDQTVWTLPLAGGEAQPVLTASRLDEPQLSPDGRWLAYVSREAGQDDVYIEPFRREGDRVRVSTAGGGQPKWRRDGRELYFVTPANRLVAVDVRAADERLDVSLPTELFEIQGIQGTGYDDYAPSADGQRFLVKVPLGQDLRPVLHVVTNWTSLLR
jgi:eukaryotic-like serine/threonine-protein kinase